jgi:sporulation protein YlmC with PRC-barrel domain
MKLTNLVAASLFLASLALPALGQAPTQPVRVGEFDDRPVVDSSGSKVADVYDVVVDTEEARVAYIVFSVGMKVVPLPMPSTDMVFTDKRIELSMPRGRLESMPALDMAALGPRYKRGRNFQGNPLKDPNGVLLAEVKDLMFDLSSGSITALVVEFDKKVRPEPGWVALPRSSVKVEGGVYVATFKLDDMRPEAQARAEQQRFDTARAAALTVDRDERFTELKGRSFLDPQGKVLGQIVDVVTDAAGTRALHALVDAGGSVSSVALPLQGATRNGTNYVLPTGAAALAPAPGGGKRLSEQIGKGLVDSRGKDVGKVRDMVVNLASGKVRYAVAEFEPAWIAAGYLVPIKVPGEDRKIDLAALTGSMIFEGARWPDINNPQFISNMDAYIARQK